MCFFFKSGKLTQFKFCHLAGILIMVLQCASISRYLSYVLAKLIDYSLDMLTSVLKIVYTELQSHNLMKVNVEKC